MYDDEEVYGDEMEYDEELSPGEAGDVVSEEEEIEGVGPMEGLSGDVGMDLEVVLDDEDHDDEDDEDDEDDDEEDSDLSDLPEGGPWGNEDDSDWTEEAEDQEIHDDADDDDGDDIEAGNLAIEPDSVAAGILDGLRGSDPSGLIREELGMDLDPEGYMEEVMDEDEGAFFVACQSFARC
jgi:E3 ubiquitin-protein ligase HUWE1